MLFVEKQQIQCAHADTPVFSINSDIQLTFNNWHERYLGNYYQISSLVKLNHDAAG